MHCVGFWALRAFRNVPMDTEKMRLSVEAALQVVARFSRARKAIEASVSTVGRAEAAAARSTREAVRDDFILEMQAARRDYD